MISRGLLLLALPLTLAVIVFGAFVRLSDAGLGCPDWPGCYGELIGVADAETAARRHPESPYDGRKAWIETAHRYIAALLGLLLAAAAVADWVARRRITAVWWLPPLVVGQALLGMLTVTERLKPAIVVCHLLGGMLILAVVVFCVSKKRLSALVGEMQLWRLKKWWRWAALALGVQIALGGWVSTNYAGLACPDFPLCQGGLAPPVVDFSGFAVGRELHQFSDGTPVTAAALATIHWVHRVMALGVVAVFLGLARFLWVYGARREGGRLAVLLAVQVGLGAVNVWWQLPMWAAVAHNGVAALLVAEMAAIGARLRR